ncbi:hypothetical protein AC1031_005986 [Aphanomyces cochlioides]|nr:hypothetical protein AC1031_005986 [Aphanomyces cochlioides]
MKTCVALLVAAAATTVQAWWDNGHMLVAEVASQALAPNDLATINSLLSQYDDAFPNTGSVTTAAIWADLIKCDSIVSTYCPSTTTPALKMLDNWHFIDLPLNVNGSDYQGLTSANGDALVAASLGGQAYEIMTKTFTFFGKTQSSHAANWALRMFIHIFGDIQNPMHDVAGVSNVLPGGDAGGNSFLFNSPCPSTNLHALWDSVGAKYGTVNWSPSFTVGSPDYTALQKNATYIATKYANLTDSLNFAALKDVDYATFTAAMNNKPSKVLGNILESYDNARQVAYKNIDLNCQLDAKGKCYNPCPSQAYYDSVIETSEKQIALGGKRLAVILTQFARQIRTLNLATPTKPSVHIHTYAMRSFHASS